MGYKKINYTLTLFLILIITSCKKKSDNYTSVKWEVLNPVTGEGYSNVPVTLTEVRYGSSASSNTIWSGVTNENGFAEHQFKAYTSSDYDYTGSADLSLLGSLGFHYSIIKQPSLGQLVKHQNNALVYETVPYSDYYLQIENVNCENSTDQMRYRSNRIYTEPNDGFSNWSPSPTLTSGYYEGCYSSLSDLRTNRSDSVIYEIEVTRNGQTEIITKKVFRDPSIIDTIKLHY